MPEAFEKAAVADGLRRLRSAIHTWLSRDLTGGASVEPTRAYADLTLAFGFARLGCADDARACIVDAEARLTTTAGEARRWLFRLYRYRIDEALCGNRHGGLVPREFRPDELYLPDSSGAVRTIEVNAPIVREAYATAGLCAQSRILDPEECSDQYANWSTDSFARRFMALGFHTDASQVEVNVQQIVADSERMKPDQRTLCWSSMFPIVRRACPEVATQLVFAIPDVVLAATESKDPRWRRRTLQLVTQAVEHVADLPDAEPFPPLVDTGVLLAEREKDAAEQHATLEQLTWAYLRWFRRLDQVEETARYLYRTQDRWPTGDLLSGRRPELRAAAIRAFLARAACESRMGKDVLPAALTSAAEAICAHRAVRQWESKSETELAVCITRVLAFLPTASAFERFGAILDTLPRLTNTYTTAAYYSRYHLRIVEAVVLTFSAIGDF